MLLHDPERYGIAVGDVTVRLLEDVSWQQDAACVEVDPEISSPSADNPAAPRARCAPGARCRRLLALAITNNGEFGVWGGTSARERR